MKRFGKAPGDRMIPYQFAVPESVHKKVTKRFRDAEIKMAPFLRMYFTKLADVDFDRLLSSLEKFNRRKKRGLKKI